MGAQLVSWPGDPAIERIQLIAALAKVELELPAPDADVKVRPSPCRIRLAPALLEEPSAAPLAAAEQFTRRRP